MKSDLECILCLFKQGLNTARLITSESAAQREILNKIASEVEKIDLNLSPAILSKRIYTIVSEVTGIADPFDHAKEQSNREALRIVPDVKRIITDSKDPLMTALHVAVAGNIIDLGIGHKFNLSEDINKLILTPFAIDNSDEFKKEIKAGRQLLYLGDNAGEIVFDRLLVEQLLKYSLDITFCVKERPIINDATMEDAKIAGLTDLVPVITTGSDDIGVNLERSSRQFIDALNNSEIIIAKGHGNIETCIELPQNFYFLLKAKCDVVSNALKVKTGDIVFKHKPAVKQ